jgi:hypothetical protein
MGVATQAGDSTSNDNNGMNIALRGMGMLGHACKSRAA